MTTPDQPAPSQKQSDNSQRPPVADPVGTADEVGRLNALVHEIRNLLDGSLRWLVLAKRTLSEGAFKEHEEQLAEVQHQLEVASQALERMCGLVHAAMQGATLPIGSVLLGGTKPITLDGAISHALDVVRPLAAERMITLTSSIGPKVRGLPAGGLYSVVLNGLRNAVESVIKAGGIGNVAIVARLATDGQVLIEITDDGVGITREVGEKAFTRGFTTKAGSAGLGLAVARGILEASNGSIELLPRADCKDQSRPGAMLRIKVPAERKDGSEA